MSTYYESKYFDGDRIEIGMSNPPHPGFHHTGDVRHQMSPQTDPAVVKRCINRLKSYSVIAMILSFFTIVSGATTLGVAAKNIGFPVFNFGPLLVGILFFICGSVGYNACKKEEITDTHQKRLSFMKCGIIAVFAISVTAISLAILSAVFAILSGAVCAGADIQFYSRNNNVRKKLDVKQYCSPNDTANTVLAFVDATLCVLVAIWCIFGTLFFCCYGRYFGIKSRRRGC